MVLTPPIDSKSSQQMIGGVQRMTGALWLGASGRRGTATRTIRSSLVSQYLIKCIWYDLLVGSMANYMWGKMATGAGDQYWEQQMLPSVFKHDLIRRYLPVFAGKTGSRAGSVVYLDGYAGRG